MAVLQSVEKKQMMEGGVVKVKQGNGTLDWLETQWGGWMGGGGCQDQQEVK